MQRRKERPVVAVEPDSEYVRERRGGGQECENDRRGEDLYDSRLHARYPSHSPQPERQVHSAHIVASSKDVAGFTSDLAIDGIDRAVRHVIAAVQSRFRRAAKGCPRGALKLHHRPIAAESAHPCCHIASMTPGT